ncbi:MAG: hypothetical protein HKN00_12235 [Flavobacteriaceae bacterium]|nr:hypothetical protein [Bacteroidia bacterium]NNF75949.1 hypothetical protein [Flavobacteriaceae bacterium]NNK73873.1 hypothetical protein [Flavobacteriaceae bacterium]
MKVVETVNNPKIQWLCVQAEPDWIGTILTFEISPTEDKTLLRFNHDKWPTHGDFFARWNFSWAKYFVSLRDYVDRGLGQPYAPNESN